MGLLKAQCGICLKQVGLLNRLMLSDLHWCCFDCIKLFGHVIGDGVLKQNSSVLKGIYNYLEESNGKLKDLKITRSL